MTTYNDKTLLELAYKALMSGANLNDDKDMLKRWNPLEKDDDALRLAVKLGIDIQHHFKHVETWKVGLNEIMEFHDDDPYAATRRAIVRAAAVIGEKL